MTFHERGASGRVWERAGGRRSIRRRLGGIALAMALGLACPAAAQGDIPELRLDVSAFRVEGDNPLPASETDRVLAPFLGPHVGVAGLEAAADALEQAIRSRDYAFHRVILPPQRPEGGVVQLQVLTFKLGEVRVSGNQHFSSENVLRSLPALKPGETPDARALSRSLAIAGDHPVKRTTVTMREGKAPDTVDAEVKVKDAKPLQGFVALNNTGTEDTGDTRLLFGAQHSNLFDTDQSVTVGWTTSPGHISDVNQYGVNYWAPIYALGGAVSAYAVYSNVDSGTVANFFQVSGSGTFMGARYNHAFLRQGNYAHNLALGLDDRMFRNDVTFSGSPIGVDVRSRPVSLRYSGRWDDAWGLAAFFAEYARNLSGGAENTDLAYAAQSGSPKQSWDAVRLGIDANYALPRGYFLSGRFRSQLASQALIPGEQMGLGGMYSIRGFTERATTGDLAYQLNLEAWTPDLGNRVRLLAFWDSAYARLDSAQPGQQSSQNLGSIGAGLQWNWRDQLDLTVFVGHIVNGLTGDSENDTGRTRANFNLVYRF